MADQLEKGIEVCDDNLGRFVLEKYFLSREITRDEIWIYYFNPKLKRENELKHVFGWLASFGPVCPRNARII